jgi:uncharacterized membrane protein
LEKAAKRAKLVRLVVLKVFVFNKTVLKSGPIMAHISAVALPLAILLLNQYLSELLLAVDQRR